MSLNPSVRRQLERTLLLHALIFLAIAAPADAQYLYLDTNGDGEHSTADVIATSGTTIADLWIRTDRNRDGSQATCVTEDGELSIAGYEFVLRASNGSIQWGQFENAIPQFSVVVPPTSIASEYHVGYSGEVLAPGTYRLSRLTINVASGTPSIVFAPIGASNGSWLTGFVSRCSGLDFDNTVKLGLDWQDADGLSYGGEVKHPPRIVPTRTLFVAEGAVADVAVAGTDEDGDPLQFFLGPAPAFVTLTTLSPGAGTAAGNLHIAPSYDVSGILGFALGVTDGVFRDSTQVRLEVLETNRPPHLGRWPNDYYIEGGQPSLDFLALSDPDVGQSVQAFMVSGPRYMRVEQPYPDVALLHLTPTIFDVGSTSGTVGLTDGYLTVTDTFGITVYALPQISPLQDMSVAIGETATQEFTATDPDGGAMTLVLAGGPPFISASVLDSAPGTLRGLLRLSPQSFDVGDATGTIAVQEEQGESLARFHVHVFDPTGQAGAARPLFASTFLGFRLPKEPRVVGWGDFNEDGVLDAAAACEGDYELDGSVQPIQILDGRRDGTFQSGATIPDVFGARDISVADLDGDGHADILVSGGNFIRWFAGRGDGTFVSGNDLALGFNFGAVRAADFNEDGHPDLVATSISQAGSRVFVFLNDGAGAFPEPVDLTGVGSYPLALTAGDLDGDAHVDVIVGDVYDGSIARWLGRGDGTFSSARMIQTNGQGGRYQLADLDSDGDLDLAVPETGFGRLRILENQGDVGFLERTTVAPDGGVDFCSFGDLDSDGDLDLVTARTGTATLETFTSNGFFTFVPSERIHSAFSALDPILRDVNFDGKLDILSLDYAGDQLAVHRQEHGGGFGGVPIVRTREAPAWIVSGDWNQDRIVDVAVGARGSGEIEFLTAQNGVLRSTGTVTLPGAPSRVRVADLDGDQIPELVATIPTESSLYVIRPGTGGGMVGTVPWTHPISDFDVADWNGDGSLDLIVTSGFGFFDSTAVLAAGQEGAFHEIARVRGHGGRIAVGDFNGDALRDIAMLIPSSGYPITVAWGAAGGGLEAPYYYPVSPRNFSDLAVLGRDPAGRDGLGVVSAEANTIAIYRGDPGFALTLQGSLRTGACPSAPSVGDLNGDGARDLVIANAAGNSFSILPGSSDGSIGSPQDFGAGAGAVGVALGDMDGDGRLDVLVSNESDHTVSIHRNLGTSRINRVPVAVTGGPYAGVAGSPIDFDGSRSSDADGDALGFRWNFGDGVEGVGSHAAHAYAASGTYRVGLTVDDGVLNASDSTTSVISAVLAARVFRTRDTTPIVVGAGPPTSCISFEPVAGAFSVSDVDPGAVWLIASTSGASDSIQAVTGKGTLISDADRDGVMDRSACFTREDLADLFSGATGRVSVPVRLRCRLFNGAIVDGATALLVLARGGGLASYVKPQPMSRGGVIGFRLTAPTVGSIRLFDARGRLVRTLQAKGPLVAGYHEVPFEVPGAGNARIPSGVYFYLIETKSASETGRVLIAH